MELTEKFSSHHFKFQKKIQHRQNQKNRAVLCCKYRHKIQINKVMIFKTFGVPKHKKGYDLVLIITKSKKIKKNNYCKIIII